MVRGVEKRLLFLDDRDRERLFERLGDVLAETETRCFAWAFMPNHVHLVLRTGDVSISKLMQRVLTSYSLRFNLRHDRVGHLVQNRFKSKLVLDEEYLLPLIRYVHRNPVEAGLVRSVEDLARFRWCGHAALMGRRPTSFEAVDEVLGLFDPDPLIARERIHVWMRSVQDPPLPVHLEGRRQEEPQRPRTGPRVGRGSLDRLIRDLCAQHGVAIEDLLSGRRDRVTARARSVIAYRATRELHLSVVGVAEKLGISPPAVVQAAARYRTPRPLAPLDPTS